MRAWLLPLFKENIKKTNLLYFVRYFIPLADRLKQRSLEAQQQNRNVEAKNLSILYFQIWELFPSFCNHPTDLTEVCTLFYTVSWNNVEILTVFFLKYYFTANFDKINHFTN